MAKTVNYNIAPIPNAGSVLILVLIVVAGMTVLSMGLAYRTRVEIKLVNSHAQRTYVYYIALGGMERIKAHLGAEEISASNIARICSFNSHAAAENLLGASENPLAQGRQLFYYLKDEQAHFDLNRSDPASWEQIHNLPKELRAGILDWQDSDDDISSEGAESDFYEMLDPPYQSKNSAYSLLKELLYVNNVSLKNYIGEDQNHNNILEANENDGWQQKPYDNHDGVLDLGLIDIFTVNGSQKININTAPAFIFSALPGLDEEVADIIVNCRAGSDGRVGTDDDVCFENAEDLVKLEELTELQRDLLGQYCCYESQYFRIFTRASLENGIDCCLMATASVADNEVKIIYLERLPQ